MSRTRILEIVALIRDGWRPYNAVPDDSVYKKLDCERFRSSKKGPFWFTKNDIFCCIGCQKNCTLQRPAGFPLPLPIRYPAPLENQWYLTPEEMLAAHDLLTARQAAYVLNVSERKIYHLIADGRLARLRERPVRVRSSEVRQLREDFDE